MRNLPQSPKIVHVVVLSVVELGVGPDKFASHRFVQLGPL